MGTIRIETIRFSFNYSNPLRFETLRLCEYNYIPLISFRSVNIYQGEVPKYGVSLPCGPIRMGKLFSKWVYFRILDTHIRAQISQVSPLGSYYICEFHKPL